MRVLVELMLKNIIDLCHIVIKQAYRVPVIHIPVVQIHDSEKAVIKNTTNLVIEVFVSHLSSVWTCNAE